MTAFFAVQNTALYTVNKLKRTWNKYTNCEIMKVIMKVTIIKVLEYLWQYI